MAGSEDWADRVITLQDGMAVPVGAYKLLLNLEDRGFTLEQDGTSTLLARPADQLTDEDCVQLTRWKWHVLNLIRYCQAADRGAHLWDVPESRHWLPACVRR